MRKKILLDPRNYREIVKDYLKTPRLLRSIGKITNQEIYKKLDQHSWNEKSDVLLHEGQDEAIAIWEKVIAAYKALIAKDALLSTQKTYDNALLDGIAAMQGYFGGRDREWKYRLGVFPDYPDPSPEDAKDDPTARKALANEPDPPTEAEAEAPAAEAEAPAAAPAAPAAPAEERPRKAPPPRKAVTKEECWTEKEDEEVNPDTGKPDVWYEQAGKESVWDLYERVKDEKTGEMVKTGNMLKKCSAGGRRRRTRGGDKPPGPKPPPAAGRRRKTRRSTRGRRR
jgi:hypothetical protein